ncbi:hypothetical protein HLH13_01625 [Acinetobacter sp. ANC 4279]|uniref:Uncharacterized protein n=1 Tax=Acinetobacter terrae TaxID=2731247 RepID=A0ABX1UYH0_9GAMM|nr:hypothetical protein [Acinetobacter terrae]
MYSRKNIITQRDQHEILERLEKEKVANASVNEFQDIWEHPQLKARQRWIEVDSPIGKIPTT